MLVNAFYLHIVDQFSVTGAGGSGTPIICGGNKVMCLYSCLCCIFTLLILYLTTQTLVIFNSLKRIYIYTTIIGPTSFCRLQWERLSRCQFERRLNNCNQVTWYNGIPDKKNMIYSKNISLDKALTKITWWLLLLHVSFVLQITQYKCGEEAGGKHVKSLIINDKKICVIEKYW